MSGSGPRVINRRISLAPLFDQSPVCDELLDDAGRIDAQVEHRADIGFGQVARTHCCAPLEPRSGWWRCVPAGDSWQSPRSSEPQPLLAGREAGAGSEGGEQARSGGLTLRATLPLGPRAQSIPPGPRRLVGLGRVAGKRFPGADVGVCVALRRRRAERLVAPRLRVISLRRGSSRRSYPDRSRRWRTHRGRCLRCAG